jgi:hypothetical protein
VTIVGILADVKYSKPDAEATPEVFVAYQRGARSVMALKSPRGPRPIRQHWCAPAAQADRRHRPHTTIYDVKTLEQALTDSSRRAANLFLLATFARRRCCWPSSESTA